MPVIAKCTCHEVCEECGVDLLIERHDEDCLNHFLEVAEKHDQSQFEFSRNN